MKDVSGFSLVEMMVALAISSVLLLGLTNIFLSSNQSQVTQRALGDIHETGRFALDQMARHLRMTGARSSNWTIGPVPGAFNALDGPSDSFSVTYQDTVDCNMAAPAGDFVTNTFDVVDGVLRCNGVDLIDGILELQLFLGEDTDGDRIANRLVAPGAAGLQMNRVVSVNINVIAVSADDRVGSNQPILRNAFWTSAPETDDRRLWREYSTTVSLRNSL